MSDDPPASKDTARSASDSPPDARTAVRRGGAAARAPEPQDSVTRPLRSSGGLLDSVTAVRRRGDEPSAPASPASEEQAPASDELTTAKLRRGEDLDAHWHGLGVDPDTARLDRDGTIVPHPPSTRRSAMHAAPEPALGALPTLQVGERGSPDAEFQLGAVLGSGGMGVVQTALQTTLEREVAIKALRPEADPTEASPQLLLEARVTGTLEHPNVVPVHAIGRDGQNRPLIVMKRIEGRSWEQLIAEVGSERDGNLDELLTRHLNILLQVVRAVHFAHSKGILHRDLKPANVMIGEFGEVYVVDWGVAVALDERAPRGLPLARECRDLAGTPAYMAPEMAACDGESLSARTDVYLLGGILHELLTGFAPHAAPTLRETLRRAFASNPPRYGPEVPPGLAAICRRAMAWDPAERYAGAGELAQAVEQFLQYRSSTTLSDEAGRRLAKLRSALAQLDATDEEQVAAVRATFSEARFAFTHALRTWDENEPARAGLQQALELMIDFELRSGQESAAALLLAELPTPNAELGARVTAAIEAARAAEQRLAQLERDADLGIGDRLRATILTAGSLGWSACCIGTGWLRRSGTYLVSAREFGVVCLAFGALLGLTAFVGRRTLYANAVTRRIAHTALLIFVSYGALWFAGHELGAPAEAISAAAMVAGIALWLTLALHVQRLWAGMAVGMAAGVVAILIWPQYNFELMGAATLVGGVLGGIARRLGLGAAPQTMDPRSTSSPT